MRLPRAWTDADGAPSGMSEPDAVFSVDAIRALLEIVEALHRRGVIDAGGGVGTGEGLERGTPCSSKRFSTSGETTSRSCGDDSRSEARWAKARRGEVFTAVPSGYDLDATGQVTRTSDETVADAVTRVFEKFDELGTSGRGDEARKGAPREGRALLQGLVRCGQCGRRMMVSCGGGAGPAHAARC